NINRYLLATSVPEKIHTIVAVSLLGDDASSWFDGAGLADSVEFPKFEEEFRKMYIPADFNRVVRSRLFELRMTSSVEVYIAEYKKLLMALLAENPLQAVRNDIEANAHIRFIDGCPKALQEILEALLISKDLSIYELFLAAEKFDRIYHFRPDTSKTSTKNTISTHSSVVANQLQSLPQAATPMEIDNLKMEINALRKENNRLKYQGRGRQQNSNDGLKPLTASERQWLRDNNGCFKCREVGHHQRECSKGKPPTRPAKLNNLSVDEDSSPDSGKVPSNQE
ncbi:hypothetical protein BGW38_009580, partial [Lunasporangiospora selenospora]